MSEDRTAPMGRPQRAGPENDQDDQRTILSDQEGGLPPTIRMPDAEPGGWGHQRRAAFDARPC